MPEQVTRGDAFPFLLGEEPPSGAFEGARALVHCAYDFTVRSWPEIQAANIRGSAKLFSAASAAGIERIVCISTMSAFAGCASLYGCAKLEIEGHASTVGALILRPGLIWGQQAGGMFGSLVKQVQGSKVLPLIGGQQLLYLVHGEDLAGLIQRFCDDKFSAPPVPVTAAHAQPWTFRAILREIAAALGRHPAFIPVPARLVWAVLKAAETCGLRLNFRSDSLVSLMNQDLHPDFSQGPKISFTPRPFAFKVDAPVS